MSSPLFRYVLLAMLAFLAHPFCGYADAPVAAAVLNPRTAAEAWNVIHLATKNVDALLNEGRLAEVPVQIALCGPALRVLNGATRNPADFEQAEAKTARAQNSVNAVVRAALSKNPVGARSALDSLATSLEDIAQYFDAKTVSAEIFLCPMHADFISENEKTPCSKCGMDLLKRRIPYSFIYTKPGEPSVRMTANASGPIEAGRKVEIKVRLEKSDKSPLLHEDLLRMHTEFIHLLIEEPGLGDYHHEHPTPSDVPGEYTFSFTPQKTAPYRIWADIVPAATGVQELPFADLPSSEKPAAVVATENRFSSEAGGYQFALELSNGNHLPVIAGQTRQMSISVQTPDAKPVTTLEPVMNAFAHLVGFYSDFATVVHLHPSGGDVVDSELRGGPSLNFQFFPPKAGFIRLYCQVLVGGKMLFAPFDLNVQP